jgi:hypothetical protein
MEFVLCHKLEYCYLEEYIRSVLPDKSLFLYDGETPLIFNGNVFWCIRRIPFHIIPPGSTIKFVNTEQLSVPQKFAEFKQFIVNGVQVYDYSLENIRISGTGSHLPYKEIPEETQKLKEFLLQPKEHDFALIGTPSLYRTTKIKEIVEKGYTVHHIHGWRDERDKEVAKCKYILNLHYSPEYTVYESIRCERWRFAGMPIYSEASLDLPEGVLGIDLITTRVNSAS